MLEDRLLLENRKSQDRTPGFDPEKDWFSHASWQYQCGLERHANIHLAADDVPNFIRSMLNQYAVDIMPGEYTFREHTTGGPPDKIYEESCFLERFRMMLVMEEGDVLAGAGHSAGWLEQGKRIAVKNAPTHFGALTSRLSPTSTMAASQSCSKSRPGLRQPGCRCNCAIRPLPELPRSASTGRSGLNLTHPTDW